MSGAGGGERDLTAVLIGACVGSMTVLVFTIGILAFIYWCCFRERIRWWRKFETAALVLGNASNRDRTAPISSSRDASIKTVSNKLIDSSVMAHHHPLSGVSAISGSVVHLADPNHNRNYNNMHGNKQRNDGNYGGSKAVGICSPGTATNSLDRSQQNQPLVPSMKTGIAMSMTHIAKRPSLNIGSNCMAAGHYNKGRPSLIPASKVRPGVSLAALPTSAQSASNHYYQWYPQLNPHTQYLLSQSQKYQQHFGTNPNMNMNSTKRAAPPLPNHVVRRTSHQSKIQLGTIGGQPHMMPHNRTRGISVPNDDRSSDDYTAILVPPTLRSTSSTTSSFAQSAKKWTSMPAITHALGDLVTMREREKVVRTASKRGTHDNSEEVSSSWRIPTTAFAYPAVVNHQRRRQTTTVSHLPLPMPTSNSASTTTNVTTPGSAGTPSKQQQNTNNRSVLSEVPGSPNFEPQHDDYQQPVANNNKHPKPIINQNYQAAHQKQQQHQQQQQQQHQQNSEKQMAMLMMTREAKYTFMAEESPEIFRKPAAVHRMNPVESPPPAVSAMVGASLTGTVVAPKQTMTMSMKTSMQVVQTSISSNSGEYGSHSSRVSADHDSAIVVTDGQSTSSKNNTDFEHSTSSHEHSPPPTISSSNNATTTPLKPVAKRPSVLKKTQPTNVVPQPQQPQISADDQPSMIPMSVPNKNNDLHQHAPSSVVMTKQPASLNGGSNAIISSSNAADDLVSSSMRSKISKIRRYKQRSKTTGASGMANMRSLSVVDLNRPPKMMQMNGGLDDPHRSRDDSSRPAMPRVASQRQQRRVTGEIFAASHATNSAITGHAIGVHVDALAKPPATSNVSLIGMRRYATMEALMDNNNNNNNNNSSNNNNNNDSSNGTYVGAAVTRMSVVSNGGQLVTLPNAASASNNGEQATTNQATTTTSVKPAAAPQSRVLPASSSMTTKPRVEPPVLSEVSVDPSPMPSKLGSRLSVGLSEGKPNGATNGTTTNGVIRKVSNTTTRRPEHSGTGSLARNVAAATKVYSPTAASYNVEQATRQHHQQQQQQLLGKAAVAAPTRKAAVLFPEVEDDDDDDTISIADQAKRVTENAFKFLNEFSEAETQSQRSVDNDDDSPATSDPSESSNELRDIAIPPSKAILNTNSVARTQRGSPAPSINGRQFKQQELKLGDWL